MSEQEYTYIRDNLDRIRERIAKAAIECGRRPEEIQLMAVTKTVDPDRINYAIENGVTLIGENRVQEMLSKKDSLKLENCDLHIIGHLQTNKVKYVIPAVSTIQSVDSVKLAREISRYSEKQGVTTKVLVEVNIGGEESKSGVRPEDTMKLLEEISEIGNIQVGGLMTIPPICDDSQKIRGYFRKLYKLFVDIEAKKIDNISMGILSMGMSDDYYEAILEGATMVRIGSAIFGKRDNTGRNSFK